MAKIYVRSTDGNDADSGATWALAKAKLAGAFAIDAAGDEIFLSQAHSETTAGNVSPAWAGTRTSPTHVIAANDGAEPPTATSTAAVFTTTGATTVNWSSAGGLYVYGLTMNVGTGAVTASLNLNQTGGGRHVFESCTFNIVATGAASLINVVGASAPCVTEWRDCYIKSATTGPIINMNGAPHVFRWIGGGVVSGTSTPSSGNAIFAASDGASALIEGVDLSKFYSGVHIHNGGGSPSLFVMRNCKLPSGWSGSLSRTAVTGGSKRAMYNCSDGSENYRLWIEKQEGTIRDETTFVRAGGATDGVTPISWKLTTVAAVSAFAGPLHTDDIVVRVNAAGTYTLSLHILHDSATNLTDAEAWVEAEYLGSSSQPLASIITDRVADFLTTAADQASSSETWTTTGMSNPNKQKLSVTFTVNMAGFVIVRGALAKASKTAYFCPKVDLA